MKLKNSMIDIFAITARGFREKKRYIVNEGGTRSGKTYAVLSLLYHIANTRRVLISVVSETFPHLRKGAIRDFKNIVEQMGVWDAEAWSKSESTYNFANGSKIEFFSVDSPGKVHGPTRDILFINEAQNISYDIARHLFVRTTGTIFVDFNPTHEFWAHTELKQDPATLWVHSTYKDNPFLAPEQLMEIERNKKNANWWRVYGQGLIGHLEGLVFPSVQMVDAFPEGVQTYYGLDFGYSNDPTALVKIGVDRDKIYFDELIYQTGLTNPDIVRLMEQAGVRKHYDEVFADSAEPKSIQEIYLSGFNVKPAAKGRDSINAGIDKIKQHDIFVTKRSVNLMREFRNYTWVTDKEGRATNKPIDTFNHGIDAIRYGIEQLYKTPTVRVVRPKRNDKHRT